MNLIVKVLKTNIPYLFRIVFIILFIFSTNSLFGQTIVGKVLDKDTQEPLENVNIYFEKFKIGTTTSKTGTFKITEIEKLSVNDSLNFSIVGYSSIKVAINKLNQNVNIVFLSKEIRELGEVIINAKRKIQPKLKYKILPSLKNGVFAFGSKVVENKLYLVAGDNSYKEDSFRKAVDKVNSSNLEPTFRDVQRVWQSGGSYKKYSSNISIYDIDSKQWKMTNTEIESRAYHQINIYDNKLYVLGGKKISTNGKREYLNNRIEIVNLDSLNVIIDNVNPHQAVNFASVIFKEYLIVMGGSTSIKNNGYKVFSNDCHVFNIRTGYWYDIGKMTTAKETNGVIVQNKVYLIGGFNGEALSEIESFDVITGEWKKEGSLFSGTERPGLSSHDDKIYIFDKGKIIIFDTKLSTLKEYQIDLPLHNVNLHYYKGKLYILGGYLKERYSIKPSSGFFEIDLNQFQNTQVTRSKNFKNK